MFKSNRFLIVVAQHENCKLNAMMSRDGYMYTISNLGYPSSNSMLVDKETVVAFLLGAKDVLL